MRRFLLFVVCCFVALLVTPVTADAQTARPLAYLGLEFRWGGDASAERFLHVQRVAPNGPAEKAAIRPGDLITHVAAVRVDFGDELDFLQFMRKRRAGERLSMTVVRSGKSATRVITLAALPEAARARWELNFRMAEERRAAAKTATRRK
jgi:S1-C subfamily serine protease